MCSILVCLFLSLLRNLSRNPSKRRAKKNTRSDQKILEQKGTRCEFVETTLKKRDVRKDARKKPKGKEKLVKIELEKYLLHNFSDFQN